MGLLRPKLHTGHHQFCLILLAKASHMAGCESRVKSRGRTFHQQWKNMAVIYGPGHRQKMPLSLTLKDQKEEFAKGMHSILGKGNGMWRGMQSDRTWHVKASGSSESLEQMLVLDGRDVSQSDEGCQSFSKMLQNPLIAHFGRLTYLDSAPGCASCCYCLHLKNNSVNLFNTNESFFFAYFADFICCHFFQCQRYPFL